MTNSSEEVYIVMVHYAKVALVALSHLACAGEAQNQFSLFSAIFSEINFKSKMAFTTLFVV